MAGTAYSSRKPTTRKIKEAFRELRVKKAPIAKAKAISLYNRLQTLKKDYEKATRKTRKHRRTKKTMRKKTNRRRC